MKWAGKLVFGFFLFLPFMVLSQTVEQKINPRPKIGLVLSGGGAKGFAHIGALKVLEEAGIQPDYIGGTSMGSIIGGLYAIGYNSQMLRELIAKLNWDELLTDKISRRNFSIEEKSEDGRYILSFPVRRTRIELPMGLRSGQNVTNMLSRLTSPAYQYKNFSDFPLPFFCMAADIENGQQVLLNKGYLPDAMRASMSIPTLFTPLELEGRLLVDGGLLNNYPVDIMKQQGANIIIGIDVQRTLYSKKELTSIRKIIDQMGNLLRNQTNIENRKITDYLIMPDLSHYSITDFNKADSMIEIGEKATRLMLPRLKLLADSLNKLGPVRPRIPIAVIPDRIPIREIRFEGLIKVPWRVVQNRLGIYVGDTISQDKLTMAIDKAYASQYFDMVTYKLEPKDDGICLIVRLVEKDYGLLRMGVHYDNDFKASLIFNADFRNLLINGTKLSVDIGLGSNPRFSLLYYLNRGRWPNVGFSIKTNALDVYSFDNQGDRTASFRYSELLADLYTETIIGNSVSLGFGPEFESSELSPDISSLRTGRIEESFLNVSSFLKVDTYDKAFYPSKGGSLFAEAKIVKGIKEKSVFNPSLVLAFRYRNAFKISQKVSIIPSVNIGMAVSDTLPYQYRSFIGGANYGQFHNLFPFVGMNFMQRSDYSALVAGCDLQYEFHHNHYLILKYNIGKTERHPGKLLWLANSIQGLGLTYGYNSPIGPVEFTVMASNYTNKTLTFINLGYWF
jgi:NTE family protein